jgi:hypothetical protein
MVSHVIVLKYLSLPSLYANICVKTVVLMYVMNHYSLLLYAILWVRIHFDLITHSINQSTRTTLVICICLYIDVLGDANFPHLHPNYALYKFGAGKSLACVFAVLSLLVAVVAAAAAAAIVCTTQYNTTQ